MQPRDSFSLEWVCNRLLCSPYLSSLGQPRELEILGNFIHHVVTCAEIQKAAHDVVSFHNQARGFVAPIFFLLGVEIPVLLLRTPEVSPLHRFRSAGDPQQQYCAGSATVAAAAEKAIHAVKVDESTHPYGHGFVKLAIQPVDQSGSVCEQYTRSVEMFGGAPTWTGVGCQ